MGWEEKNGRRYYYRKRRVGGQVISEYVGTGYAALLAEAMDIEAKHERSLERAERQTYEDVLEQAQSVRQWIKDVVDAAYIATGAL